jgi:hypothetical protein
MNSRRFVANASQQECAFFDFSTKSPSGAEAALDGIDSERLYD